MSRYLMIFPAEAYLPRKRHKEGNPLIKTSKCHRHQPASLSPTYPKGCARCCLRCCYSTPLWVTDITMPISVPLSRALILNVPSASGTRGTFGWEEIPGGVFHLLRTWCRISPRLPRGDITAEIALLRLLHGPCRRAGRSPGTSYPRQLRINNLDKMPPGICNQKLPSPSVIGFPPGACFLYCRPGRQREIGSLWWRVFSFDWWALTDH